MSDLVLLPIAGCRLDLAGLRVQRDRYRAIGRHLKRVERHPCRLEAQFNPDLDATLLRDAIAVERGCCSFLRIHYEPAGGRLSITVDDPAHDPALDALRFALGTS
jgi:hypothetical protein